MFTFRLSVFPANSPPIHKPVPKQHKHSIETTSNEINKYLKSQCRRIKFKKKTKNKQHNEVNFKIK